GDDWFSFTAPTFFDSEQPIRFVMTTPDAYGTASLYSATGVKLREFAQELDVRELLPGTYYLDVHRDGHPGSYYLEFPGPKADDRYEENDTLAQAANLGLVRDFSATSLVLSDDADWFTFQMDGIGTYGNQARVRFNHPLGDLALSLYRP